MKALKALMLDSRRKTINGRAPVMVLCTNIVKDISGVANLKPQTSSKFREAVEATLTEFRKEAGIPAKTQLEILEALGQ